MSTPVTKPAMHHSDYEIEPVPGLPEPLPAGETMLWQGAPTWQGLARRVHHVPMVALYFAVLASWRVAAGVADGDTVAVTATGAGWVVGLGLAACALLTLIAWATAKSTLYTITSKRLVLRIGMALPLTINLPFTVITAAGMRMGRDGTGDIVLTLAASQKASFFLLWPHVRPWRITRAEPMLRALPQAEAAAQVLSRALAHYAGMPVPAMPEALRGETSQAQVGQATRAAA